MANVTIDGKEYDFDSLSESAQGNLKSIQYIKSELTKLSAQVAIFRTAEKAYADALKNELDK